MSRILQKQIRAIQKNAYLSIMEEKISLHKGMLALSPLFVFVGFYLVLSLCRQDFYAVPITISFMVACLYAMCIIPGMRWGKRFELLTKGAAQPNLLLMIWIFILAGAFASTAKEMGAIDATVELALSILPSQLILGGLFAASCFISLSVGTSVGTIAALTPIATTMSEHTGHSIPLLVATVVGGAYFGDNLSFISDTTIAATKTQGCDLKDKFKVNIWIAGPAALATLVLYLFLGHPGAVSSTASIRQILLVIPYVFVLAAGIFGINVLTVLALGIIIAGGMGIALGQFDFFTWLDAMNNGVLGMSELIIATILAAGLVEVIRHQGGIHFIIQSLTKCVKGKKGAEMCIATLTLLTNFCTANNTITILTVGPLAKEIADKYNVDPRKSASLLDTFSCIAQSLIPYGAQLLIASGLAAVNPIEIIPYLHYPFVLGIFSLLNILLSYENKIFTLLGIKRNRV